MIGHESSGEFQRGVEVGVRSLADELTQQLTAVRAWLEIAHAVTPNSVPIEHAYRASLVASELNASALKAASEKTLVVSKDPNASHMDHVTFPPLLQTPLPSGKRPRAFHVKTS